MKKLFKFLKPYKLQCIFSPLFKLFEVVLELSVPLVVASIIDTAIPAGDTARVVRMCLLLLGFAALGLLCSVTAQYFAAGASVGFAHDLRGAVFSHIQRLSYSQKDSIGPAALVTRLTSDINQIQNGLNLTLRLLLRSPIVVFGAMAMAFALDTKAALIFAAAIPILCAVTFFVMLVCVPLYKKVQQKLESVLGLTRENLSGVRVIRAFGAEESEKAEYGRRNDKLTAELRHTGRVSALLNPATSVIINIAIIVLINVGAVAVDGGRLKTGEVVALYNYMSLILVELIKLANLIINLTKSIACGLRVQAVLDTPDGMVFPSRSADPDYGAPAVEFSGVCMRYGEGGDYALENIDLTVMPGQTLGIIGGTGSGKSTLVNLIPRFYDADTGAVRVFGHDVKDYTAAQLRRTVGVVPQSAELFSGTLRDNLTFGGESADENELNIALEAAQCGFVREKGLDASVEQGGKNLSGGQKQRLCIARALLRKPKILILDDSSSALDYATDAALRKSLRRLDGTTVIIVSQRVNSVSGCDRIAVIDDGRIVGLGNEKTLLESCGVFREIYASQNREA